MFMNLNCAGTGYYDVYVNGELECVMDSLEVAIVECSSASCEEVCEIFHNGEMVWSDDK